MRSSSWMLSAILITAILASAQTNTWTKVAGNGQIRDWWRPALIYAPGTDEYVLTMGAQARSGNCPYSVQVFTHALGKWINALPNDSLYGSASTANSADSAAGKWADSTGPGYFSCTQDYWGWGWGFRSVKGYLRPNTYTDGALTQAYTQFCLNTDDGKIYFYVDNVTCAYDPSTRLWDTLSVGRHPAGDVGPNPGCCGMDLPGFLKWASLCYDAYNHEVLLFGGIGLDTDHGTAGFWTFKPSTNTWTKPALDAQPSPRAHSQMVYDPVNHAIVLFGGDHLDSHLGDTWVYDCVSKTWSRKNPPVRPRPRAGHAMLYMPKSGKIVMMGGYRMGADQTTEFEMWTYDVPSNTWALIKRFDPAETWPQLLSFRPAFGGVVAVDKRDTVVALADTMLDSYYFRPVTMRMACDPTVVDVNGTATYGCTHDSTAVPSGENTPAWYAAGVSAPDMSANEAFLRSIAPGTWVKMDPPKSPTGSRAWGGTVLAADRDAIMIWAGGHAGYCNTDVPQYSIPENRWHCGYVGESPLEYWGNDGGPSPMTFNNRPMMQRHQCKALGYDENAHRMLLVQYPHTYLYSPDSMDWNPNTRLPLPDPGNLRSTYGTALCTTPSGLYCLWGDLSYLFVADSMKWRKLPQTGIALPGYYADDCGAAYDSKRNRIIYANQPTAYGTVTIATSLYEYSLTTGVASQLFPADTELTTTPGIAACYRECVYLPNQDIILYTIHTSNGNLAYDCANNRWIWFPVQGFVYPMDDISAGLMYDVKRNLIWQTDVAGNVYALRPDSSPSKAEKEAQVISAALSVSPNPFNPTVNIRIRGTYEDCTISIFSLSGGLVTRLGMGKGGLEWNASQMPSGLYLIQANFGKQVLRTKAILLK